MQRAFASTAFLFLALVVTVCRKPRPTPEQAFADSNLSDGFAFAYALRYHCDSCAPAGELVSLEEEGQVIGISLNATTKSRTAIRRAVTDVTLKMLRSSRARPLTAARVRVSVRMNVYVGIVPGAAPGIRPSKAEVYRASVERQALEQVPGWNTPILDDRTLAQAETLWLVESDRLDQVMEVIDKRTRRP